MKRILIVSTVGLIYDGITSIIISYLEAMDRSELEINVAGTIIIEPNIKKRIEDLGCRVIIFPNRKLEPQRYMWSLIKFIRKNKIEVIHAHGNSSTLAIEMIAAWIGGCRKRIVHSHNTRCDQMKIDKLLRPVFNIFYTDALACGQEAGKWLFRNRQFIILTNGRSLKKYRYNQDIREKVRKKLKVGEGLAIGHVGGFFEQKNHRFLVEIYKEIKKMEPSCKLFMIGDGPLKEEIENICKEVDVIFTGAIDNVTDYLNAMDGMLLPSFFEGLPLVTVEWQINGLPCILSDTITKECKMTKNIWFMSLETEPQKWAQEIISMAKENDRVESAIQAEIDVKQAGFDIEESAGILRGIYIK